MGTPGLIVVLFGRRIGVGDAVQMGDVAGRMQPIALQKAGTEIALPQRDVRLRRE